MLSESVKELISAALDGELTPDETRQVRELLWASAEARAFYNLLKTDRDRVRGLLPVPPPPDLRDRVMARLPAASPLATPAQSRRFPAPRRLVPVALAASLLLAVTASSFWYFLEGGNESASNGVQPPAVPGSSADRKQRPDAWVGILPNEHAVLPPAPPVVPPPHEPVANSAEPPVIDDSIPPPRALPPREAFAFPPVPPVAPFELARVRVPFLASVAELGRDDVSQSLLEDLSLHPATRVDLFTSDPGRGVEVVRAAARSQGLTLFADAAVTERIKRKQGTSYLVYLECLTPAEVQGFLTALAKADGKNTPRVLDTLHLCPAAAADARELKAVLGIDPGLWKRARPPKGEAGFDPKKPISTGTADEVAKNLTTPSGKAVAKPAVLLTFGPDAARIHPAMSAELKKYLSHRGTRKNQSLPLMIVIR
jgi:hypothetical protein